LEPEVTDISLNKRAINESDQLLALYRDAQLLNLAATRRDGAEPQDAEHDAPRRTHNAWMRRFGFPLHGVFVLISR
jgi:hypothetical protein